LLDLIEKGEKSQKKPLRSILLNETLSLILRRRFFLTAVAVYTEFKADVFILLFFKIYICWRKCEVIFTSSFQCKASTMLGCCYAFAKGF